MSSSSGAGERVRSVEVVNANGLHARPSHAIVAKALEFGATLRLRVGARDANGKSILELMTLEAAMGTTLAIGYTDSVDPTASMRSHSLAAISAR